MRLARTFSLALLFAMQFAQPAPAETLVYLGTYTQGDRDGIYVYELDEATGALAPRSSVGGVRNPSFVALHPSRPLLYSVSEIDDAEGGRGGGLAAFSMADDGALTLINQESTGGAGPCHLTVDPTGRWVLAANYGGGSVCVLPINSDGSLAPHSAFVQHLGSSVNPQRQEAPHAHSVNLDAAGRFAFVADLGLDQIRIYRFDSTRGLLPPNDPGFVAVAPGAGPRHFAFHPSGRFAYVINELGNTVTAFDYDAATGSLSEIQAIGTLPPEFEGESYTAEVVVHPSGKFVYGSNRGRDSLAVFTVDEATGKLTYVADAPTGGRTPRNFNIHPAGRWLLAANQSTNNVVVFEIDPTTGVPQPTGAEFEVPSPVCVRFAVR